MLNNLLTSYRFLRKSKTYTLINLSGLVLGLTAAFILLNITINQRSYNKSIPGSERVYRLLSIEKKRGTTEGVTPFILHYRLKKQLPATEKAGVAIRLTNLFGPVFISKKGVFNEEDDAVCANPALLEILGIQFKEGSGAGVLHDSSKMIISERAARKYFGSGKAVGRSLQIKSSGLFYPVKVEAVYRDFSWNTTFRADFITGIGFYRQLLSSSDPAPDQTMASDSNNIAETYIKVKEGVSNNELRNQLSQFNTTPAFVQQQIGFSLQPVRDIFLHSGNIQNDLERKGKPDDLYIYLLLAFIILLLAGVNYSVLSTARSAMRFREIGVRKVMGATRANLRNQILTESVLLTFIALPLSFILIGLLEPLLEPLLGPDILMYGLNWMSYLLIYAAITLIIGFLSGSYVAFFLAALSPVEALKSKFFSYKKFSAGKFFVILQLIITLALVMGLINVYRQINYCLAQTETTHKENLLVVDFDPIEFNDFEQLKTEIQTNQNVLSVSGSSMHLPSTATSFKKVKIHGNPSTSKRFEYQYIDYNFFQTMNIPLLTGREISKGEKPAGDQIAYINETGVRYLNSAQPVGTLLGPYRVAGVVKDFNFHTLHAKILPTIFLLDPKACKTLITRFRSSGQAEVINRVAKSWRKLTPTLPLDYHLYNSDLNILYEQERNFERVVGAFTLLAFLITGMGLFGLAMLLSERRMKEMAIRKIFGASNGHILYQMQKEFFIHIGIAALVAIPLSGYLLTLWLDGFYYRVTLHWLTFAASVGVVFTFVSVILFFRTLNVIRTNPVNALKYE